MGSACDGTFMAVNAGLNRLAKHGENLPLPVLDAIVERILGTAARNAAAVGYSIRDFMDEVTWTWKTSKVVELEEEGNPECGEALFVDVDDVARGIEADIVSVLGALRKGDACPSEACVQAHLVVAIAIALYSGMDGRGIVDRAALQMLAVRRAARVVLEPERVCEIPARAAGRC